MYKKIHGGINIIINIIDIIINIRNVNRPVKCSYSNANRDHNATSRTSSGTVPSRIRAKEKDKGGRSEGEGGRTEIWRQANNRGSIVATFRRRRLRLMFIHMSRTWYGAPEEEAAAAAGGDVL